MPPAATGRPRNHSPWAFAQSRKDMPLQTTQIYQRSLELVALSRVVIRAFPPGFGFLSDQLRRASASVVLNFAEGHDLGSHAEQQRFFRIARGSAQEVSAIFDVAAQFGVIAQAHHDKGRDLCDHLVRMLYRFRRTPENPGYR
jgi:four helix bundle protein